MPSAELDLAHATARAVTFAATVPFMPRGAGPHGARIALALVLVPLLLQAAPATGSHAVAVRDALASIGWSALSGAALGLGASILASAVVATGSVIDAALGSPPFSIQVEESGPISLVYQLCWAVVFLHSGGLTAMIAELARAGPSLPPAALDGRAAVALASVSARASLTLAGPPLFAQALATMAAGIVARAAPQLGGLMLGLSWSPAAALLATAIGAIALWPQLTGLAASAVEHALAFLR